MQPDISSNTSLRSPRSHDKAKTTYPMLVSLPWMLLFYVIPVLFDLLSSGPLLVCSKTCHSPLKANNLQQRNLADKVIVQLLG